VPLLLLRLAARAPRQASIALGDDFQPTCMAHPDTYLNKVVVGGADGRLQLWNFASGQRLFEFRPARCAVRCLAASPALDVVGVGLADGRAPARGPACSSVFNPRSMCCLGGRPGIFTGIGTGSAARPAMLPKRPSENGAKASRVRARSRALLHNLRYDEPVAEFANASGVGAAPTAGGGARRPPAAAGGGACTAISFRTGGLNVEQGRCA